MFWLLFSVTKDDGSEESVKAHEPMVRATRTCKGLNFFIGHK